MLPDPFVFPACPPELPERQAGDPGGPAYVVKAAVTAEHERGLKLRGTTQTDEPVSIGVSIVAPGIVRVLLEGERSDPQRITLARDLSDQAADVSLEKSNGRVTLVSDLVKVQLADPTSILNLYRHLLSYRKATPALVCGDHAPFDDVPEDCYVYLRQAGDQRVLVALNFSAQERRVALPALGEGRIAISTHLDREEAVSLADHSAGGLALRGNEGVIVELPGA